MLVRPDAPLLRHPLVVSLDVRQPREDLGDRRRMVRVQVELDVSHHAMIDLAAGRDNGRSSPGGGLTSLCGAVVWIPHPGDRTVVGITG